MELMNHFQHCAGKEAFIRWPLKWYNYHLDKVCVERF